MKKHIYVALFALLTASSLEAGKDDSETNDTNRDSLSVQRAKQAIAEIHKEWDRRQIGTKPDDELAEKRLQRKAYNQSVIMHLVAPLPEILKPPYKYHSERDQESLCFNQIKILLNFMLDGIQNFSEQNNIKCPSEIIPPNLRPHLLEIFFIPFNVALETWKGTDHCIDKLSKAGIYDHFKANTTVTCVANAIDAVKNMEEGNVSLFYKRKYRPREYLTWEEKTKIINIFLSPFSVAKVTVSDIAQATSAAGAALLQRNPKPSQSPTLKHFNIHSLMKLRNGQQLSSDEDAEFQQEFTKYKTANRGFGTEADFIAELSGIYSVQIWCYPAAMAATQGMRELQEIVQRLQNLTTEALQNSSKQPTADETVASFQKL